MSIVSLALLHSIRRTSIPIHMSCNLNCLNDENSASFSICDWACKNRPCEYKKFTDF